MFGYKNKVFLLGVSRPKNKELMDIMRHFDFVEATGHGVPNIINAYGKDVFKFSPNYINVNLPYDEEVIQTRIAKNEGLNKGINEGLNEGINEEIRFAINEYKKETIHYEKLYSYANSLKILDKVKTIFKVI